MTMQLIAIDGVAVHLPQDVSPSAMVQMSGNRFKVVPCPNAQSIGATVPVCVDEIVMMPSSRTEVWVTYRNADGVVTPAPSGASATFKMVGLTMGSGDSWPAVDLAKVHFNQSGPRQYTNTQVVVGGPSDAAALNQQPSGILNTAVPSATAAAGPSGCAALASGHRRRIFFGFSDVTVNNTFALGYEEVDQNGHVVPGSQKPAADQLGQFDPAQTTVCLPLGPGQTPVHETWELIQLSTQNHNFHIYQTRFSKTGPRGPCCRTTCHSASLLQMRRSPIRPPTTRTGPARSRSGVPGTADRLPWCSTSRSPSSEISSITVTSSSMRMEA
jgi:hypothetical protein